MDSLYEGIGLSPEAEDRDNPDSPAIPSPDTPDNSADNEPQELGPPIPQPPRVQHFPSLDVAIDTMQAFAREHGFGIVRSRSKRHKDTGEQYTVDISCVRSGSAMKSRSRGIRKMHTRRTGCPFVARVEYKNEFQAWVMTVRRGYHNHGPEDISAIVTHRRTYMNRHHQQVAAMLDENVPLRNIVEVLEPDNGYSPAADPGFVKALKALVCWKAIYSGKSSNTIGRLFAPPP